MKVLVCLVGKPGSGKTAVANCLGVLEGAKIFHYGKLLKQVQPFPGTGGYTVADRSRVNEIIADAALLNLLVIVDGNPYSKQGLDFLWGSREKFDHTIVVHLTVSDEVALRRLEERGFPIHDVSVQRSRIERFNQKLLPLIVAYAKEHGVLTIDTTNLPPGVIAAKIEAEF
jgi:adenylate kinase family enzyme